jgi:hypothetical protein
MALRNVAEAESLLALVLKPGSLDGLYQDLEALLAQPVPDGGPRDEAREETLDAPPESPPPDSNR